MIHKNRGNRRWVDKRKRRHKYNLVQKIWGDAMYFLDGILGKYDKGKIHDIDHAEKTNGKTSQKGGRDNVGYVGTLHRMDNNYSHSDKKKVEYPFYKYICGVTGLTCCGCSLFCEHRREKNE